MILDEGRPFTVRRAAPRRTTLGFLAFAPAALALRLAGGPAARDASTQREAGWRLRTLVGRQVALPGRAVDRELHGLLPGLERDALERKPIGLVDRARGLGKARGQPGMVERRPARALFRIDDNELPGASGQVIAIPEAESWSNQCGVIRILKTRPSPGRGRDPGCVAGARTRDLPAACRTRRLASSGRPLRLAPLRRRSTTPWPGER